MVATGIDAIHCRWQHLIRTQLAQPAGVDETSKEEELESTIKDQFSIYLHMLR